MARASKREALEKQLGESQEGAAAEPKPEPKPERLVSVFILRDCFITGGITTAGSLVKVPPEIAEKLRQKGLAK